VKYIEKSDMPYWGLIARTSTGQ